MPLLLPPRRRHRHRTTSLALPEISRAQLKWYVRHAIVSSVVAHMQGRAADPESAEASHLGAAALGSSLQHEVGAIAGLRQPIG